MGGMRVWCVPSSDDDVYSSKFEVMSGSPFPFPFPSNHTFPPFPHSPNHPSPTRLKHPLTAVVAGNTSSGKSSFCKKLIQYKDDLITPKITKIIYCFSEFKPSLPWESITTYSKGYSEDLISREKLGQHKTLLVIDDLADEVQSDQMTRLFTKLSHHRSISVIFLVQNLFYRGLRSMRTVSMNALYTVVFKSARDSQVKYAALSQSVYTFLCPFMLYPHFLHVPDKWVADTLPYLTLPPTVSRLSVH